MWFHRICTLTEERQGPTIPSRIAEQSYWAEQIYLNHQHQTVQRAKQRISWKIKFFETMLLLHFAALYNIIHNCSILMCFFWGGRLRFIKWNYIPNINPISVAWGKCFSPPLWFFYITLKMLKLERLNFFTFSALRLWTNFANFDACRLEDSQTAGWCCKNQ